MWSSRVPWAKRCDRRSFIGMFRCDRAATETGRCTKHNEPAHAGALHWKDKTPRRKERRADLQRKLK